MNEAWEEPAVDYGQAGSSSRTSGNAGFWDRLTDLLPPERNARQRLAFLAEASAVLGRSLDVETTLQQLADLTVPRLADWCLIDLVDDGGTCRPAALSHTDPDRAATVRELQDRYGYPAEHGPHRVVRSGEPEMLEEITDELLLSLATDDEHLELLRALEPVSAVVVPLIARGQAVGALTLVQSESKRHYREEDLQLLQDLAQRAAVAVDNAALYAERDRVARSLQQALLPPSLPDPPGLDVAAIYDTAEEADIGGDFYDVIDTPHGWVIVLGDVCGKGVEAASLSSLARHAVRSAALQDADPVHVLDVLNDALIRHEPHESFCTAACVHLRVGSDRAEAVFASAGHPPALVSRAEGTIDELDSDGMLVGLFPHPAVTKETATLHPGDVLVLYTDGVSEARCGDELFGAEGVAAALRDAAGWDAQSILAHVHTSAEAWQDEQRDDMALLAIRFRPD